MVEVKGEGQCLVTGGEWSVLRGRVYGTTLMADG